MQSAPLPSMANLAFVVSPSPFPYFTGRVVKFEKYYTRVCSTDHKHGMFPSEPINSTARSPYKADGMVDVHGASGANDPSNLP